MTDELQSKVLREVNCLQTKIFTFDFVGGKKQNAEGVQRSNEKHRITTYLGIATPQRKTFIEKDDTIPLTLQSSCGNWKR